MATSSLEERVAELEAEVKQLNEKRGSLPLSRGRWMKDFRIAHPAKQDKSLCDKSLCIDW